MEGKKSFEAIVGAVILLICALFVSHTVKIGKIQKRETYKNVLHAKFSNIDGIKVGSEVKIAGLRVGMVEETTLNPNTFQVEVKIGIKEGLNIPTDSVLAVTSSGLLGGKFLSIKPGADDMFLTNGSSFSLTQSTMNLEDLIGKVVAAFTSK